MHKVDEKLLEDETTSAADLKRAEQHSKTVSWMRRNEYISTENTRFQPKQYDAPEAKYSIVFVHILTLSLFDLKLITESATQFDAKLPRSTSTRIVKVKSTPLKKGSEQPRLP